MRVVKGVEGVEKFDLRLLLAGDELDIVDQEHVGDVVFAAEFLHALAALLQRSDHLVGEILAFQV